MSCQHRDFLSEELASLSAQEPVSPRLAKGYSPEGNWPALFHLSLFLFLIVCLLHLQWCIFIIIIIIIIIIGPVPAMSRSEIADGKEKY